MLAEWLAGGLQYERFDPVLWCGVLRISCLLLKNILVQKSFVDIGYMVGMKRSDQRGIASADGRPSPSQNEPYNYGSKTRRSGGLPEDSGTSRCTGF